MADGFIGEIRAFAFDFPPVGWASCDGSPFDIRQNQALYAVIGNLYGQVDSTTMRLPDLRGLVPMGAGNPAPAVVATGMPSSIRIATKMGSSSVSLQGSQLPSHTHQANAYVNNRAGMVAAPGAKAAVSRPIGPPIPSSTTGVLYGAWGKTETPDTQMAPAMIGPAGGAAAHENRQPYLVMNFCICIEGLFPVKSDG